MRVFARGVGLAIVLLGVPTAGTPVQQATGTLSGRIVVEGQPRAGVVVRAVPASGTTVAATATTDEAGAFQLSLPQGVYRIDAIGDGLTPALRTGIVVLAGSTSELPIAMLPAGATTLETMQFAPGEVGVRIETPYGIIILAVDATRAPITATNFLRYVDAGLYAGGRFHRVTRPDNYTAAPPNRPMMELIQGGINPERRAEGFPPIPLERTSVTGLKHVAGTVSMARGTAADTATSDFFILLDDQPSLDFGGQRFDDGEGAAAFGRVVFGLGVVRRIQQMPAEGQALTPPVPIIRINRL